MCVHHNNNGKHSVLVPFETGRRVKTKRTKPSRSEEDTKRVRGRFSPRAHRAKSHVAVCKKCDLEREEKDTIIAHNDAPVHGLASLSLFLFLFLSLSFSLRVGVRCVCVRSNARARVCFFALTRKDKRSESFFLFPSFFLKKSQTNHSPTTRNN